MRGTATNIEAGQVYSNLTLTGNRHVQNGQVKVEAKCVCGNVFFYWLGNLKRGNTKSCGCMQKSSVALANFKHGLSPRAEKMHPLYKTCAGMKSRCYNPNDLSYPDYGGRGIRVCDDWRNSYENFYQWAINNGWKIERTDVNGNYEPDNCTWITRGDQSKNKRNTISLSAFGESKCLSDWSMDERCKVSLNGLWLRMKKGWDVEQAISTGSLNEKGVRLKLIHLVKQAAK